MQPLQINNYFTIMKHFVKYAGCFMPPEPKKKKKKCYTVREYEQLHIICSRLELLWIFFVVSLVT